MLETDNLTLQKITNSNYILNVDIMTGGSSSELFCVETDLGKHLIKYEEHQDANSQFEAEVKSLILLQKFSKFNLPKIINYGSLYNSSACFLHLEYLTLSPPTPKMMKLMGKQLALLHKVKGPGRFGLDHNNYFGTVPQINTWCYSWLDLLILRFKWQMSQLHLQRLDTQNQLATCMDIIIPKLYHFFQDLIDPTTKQLTIEPSLIHGDFWIGNYKSNENEEPVVFDPCCHWAHSEMDLACMDLFHDPDPDFLSEYFKILPKMKLFDIRKQLYQVYYLLNNIIMHGTAFKPQCLQLMISLINFIDPKLCPKLSDL
ncbi:Ketosamine-3-kinase [Conidiobolus coronatus NRRL 28638]|uniref:protein-ribulosamine 3-kinase n=1 Tax=Conidiobolus coronatus (strain ATCC 28846 / CBS 209.66 / NRRL 28638) TaxID=796925 RepID=A0A137PGE4_CONC2|nr:Ketosamine-3-kinase [Conidiobolus coronatus NRRL 28638]|eukprot:KXN74062.1 Ketosamine-3-kinase [Conidiobolus coronatus NRRL 28638]